jgi:hypothetical protein
VMTAMVPAAGHRGIHGSSAPVCAVALWDRQHARRHAKASRLIFVTPYCGSRNDTVSEDLTP